MAEAAGTVTTVGSEPGEGILAGEVTQEPRRFDADFETVEAEPEDIDVLRKFYGDALVVTPDEPVAGTTEDTTPATETPAAPAIAPAADADTPSPEPPTLPTPEELEALKAQAAFGQSWQEAFKTNPAEAVKQLLASQAFTPEQRAALVTDVQKASEKPVDLSNYEPASDMERALIPSLDWVRGGREEVSSAFAIRDKDIQHTYVQAMGVQAQVEALAEILGVKLPELNVQAVFSHYDKSADGTLTDAVNKVYREAALTAAKAEKQKRAERPGTPANQGALPRGPAKIRSMEDAYMEAGRQMGLEE